MHVNAGFFCALAVKISPERDEDFSPGEAHMNRCDSAREILAESEVWDSGEGSW